MKPGVEVLETDKFEEDEEGNPGVELNPLPKAAEPPKRGKRAKQAAVRKYQEGFAAIRNTIAGLEEALEELGRLRPSNDIDIALIRLRESDFWLSRAWPPAAN